MAYRELGNIITEHAKKSKCSVVRTYCGHGINNLFHTSPNIPHYAKNKAPHTMKPGHMFTIEPMINLGMWQDEHWPDNWTAVTKDGPYYPLPLLFWVFFGFFSPHYAAAGLLSSATL
jgi:methionyl aminopeptidase